MHFKAAAIGVFEQKVIAVLGAANERDRHGVQGMIGRDFARKLGLEAATVGVGINRNPGVRPITHAALHAKRALRLRSARLHHTSKIVQRFENWKLRRALALPYFLRSTTRLSRVMKPACFSAGRSAGSKSESALEMP